MTHDSMEHRDSKTETKRHDLICCIVDVGLVPLCDEVLRPGCFTLTALNRWCRAASVADQ